MILTLTFSPVLDKSVRIASLLPEHKLRCSDLRLYPGGGGINVSRAVHVLGGKTCALFPCGGATGAALLALLEKEGVPFRAVPAAGATRESFSARDEAGGAQYRFVEPAIPLERPVLEQLLLWDAFADATLLVISGSIPPGLPAGFLGRVVQQARRSGMQVLADSSGAALRELLEAGVFLCKPSEAELQGLAGGRPLDPLQMAATAQALRRKYRVAALVVSVGAAGAWLVTESGEALIPAPPVSKRSTTGAGDSLVAGIAWMLDEGHDLADATAFGVACGSAATEGEGTGLFTRAGAWRCYAAMKAARMATH